LTSSAAPILTASGVAIAADSFISGYHSTLTNGGREARFLPGRSAGACAQQRR